jgi:hypothetical protein
VLPDAELFHSDEVMSPPLDPFDPAHLFGTVCSLTPAQAEIVLTGPAADSAEIGDFAIVECGESMLAGRLASLRLRAGGDNGVDPPVAAGSRAMVELLTTFGMDGRSAGRGIERFPRLGSRVYRAQPPLISWLFERSQAADVNRQPLLLNVAAFPDGTEVRLTPERVFGRHCAVLGATGAGKSWTLARLVEEATRYPAKVVLFDATGEFHTLRLDGARHVHIGTDPSGLDGSAEMSVPFHELTEADLFALFKPSGPTQAPKLRAAMKSLKLAMVPQLAIDGLVLKAGRRKAPYEAAYAARAADMEDPRASFDIFKLSAQIDAECVFPWGGFASNPDPARWGAPNEIERSNCVSLITRIEDMLHAPELACIFRPGTRRSVFDEIDAFAADPDLRVLRLSLKHLPFAHDAREIVANALGRHLLGLARGEQFRACPLMVVLDEAHHFLNKTLGEESARYMLDSFELLAKEGRKLSLNLCLATQRPRDIPEGILSQMGTLIIHRLTNDLDREVVERASSEVDRAAMEFVPGLQEGHAVIVGVDFPVPLVVRINRPAHEPDSAGPDYQRRWGAAAAV